MTEQFQGVRFAKPDEGDAIYNLLSGLHKENGLFSLDEAKTRQTIHDMLDPARGIIGVIDGPSGLEGSIGLFITTWWYTSDPHLTEFWNFVRPDCRKSQRAQNLLDFAKWCSEKLGVPLHVGIVSNSRVEAKQRLYRRKLKHVGSYYMWGATPRLNVEMDETLENEADREELLDEYRGAVKKLIAIDPNSGTSRKRREMRIAIERLKTVQEHAETALRGN